MAPGLPFDADVAHYLLTKSNTIMNVKMQNLLARSTDLANAINGEHGFPKGLENNPKTVENFIKALELAHTPDFRHIPLNLQQGMVSTMNFEVVNNVVAIYSKHKGVVVIDPMYRDYQDYIIICIKTNVDIAIASIQYGDAFHIDTWDKKIDEYQPIKIKDLNELDTFIASDQPEQCRECGARTEFIQIDDQKQQHRCPKCGYEYFVDAED